MATYQQLKEAQPDMAALLEELLANIPICYLATVRKNGAPRVHPFCPIFGGDRMYIAVNQTSPKRWDLDRDGRYAMHALPGPPRGTRGDDEWYATGRARRITDPAEFQLVVESAGHTVHDTDWVFELSLDYVMTGWWENMGQADTYAVRREWRANAE
jgi:hypothetical protein